MWTMADDDLARLCLEHLEAIVRTRDGASSPPAAADPVAYPVFLRSYEEERKALSRGLPVEGLSTIGRNGEFAHILMEDVYWRTRKRMRDLAATLTPAVNHHDGTPSRRHRP
jgi:hypothetical protein